MERRSGELKNRLRQLQGIAQLSYRARKALAFHWVLVRRSNHLPHMRLGALLPQLESNWKIRMESNPPLALSRRELLMAASAASMAGASNAANESSEKPVVRPEVLIAAPVTLTINGQAHTLHLDLRTSLLDALREHLHFTGTKKGCDHGQCGACTVLLDGRRINSCLSLAVMHEGAQITTIEGLGTPDQLHPLQAAFVKHDAYQCGYCTPGQICSAVGMLKEMDEGVPSHVTSDLLERPVPSPEEMRERMSGNICRCGAYSNIIDALSEVSEQRT